MTTVTMQFGRVSAVDGMEYRLRIKDDASGSVVCEITMTAEQFAEVITSASTPGIAVEWCAVANIGKRREVKTVRVHVPKAKDRRQAAENAVREHEVDGWKGYVDDAMNMHKHRGADHYDVGFVRFVELAENEAG